MAGSAAYEGSDSAKRDPWEYLWWSRRQEYDMTFEWNTSELLKGINLLPWLGGLSLVPLEKNTALYAAALAGGFGYGFDAMPSGDVLWDGPQSEAVVKKWVRFYRDHERFFSEGDMLHVRRPDGQHLDAVAHVLPGAVPKALLVVYNPVPTDQADQFVIPFDKLDLPLAGWKLAASGPDGRFDVLANGVRAQLPARGVGWCVLEQAAPARRKPGASGQTARK